MLLELKFLLIFHILTLFYKQDLGSSCLRSQNGRGRVPGGRPEAETEGL